MSVGYAILMDIDGNKIDFSAMPKGCKTPKMANLKRLEARSTWMITTTEVTPNITWKYIIKGEKWPYIYTPQKNVVLRQLFYKIKLEDGVDAKEFLEKYRIVDSNGDVYIIEERE